MSVIGQENPAADRTLPSLTAEYVARWETRSSVRTRPRKTSEDEVRAQLEAAGFTVQAVRYNAGGVLPIVTAVK